MPSSHPGTPSRWTKHAVYLGYVYKLRSSNKQTCFQTYWIIGVFITRQNLRAQIVEPGLFISRHIFVDRHIGCLLKLCASIMHLLLDNVLEAFFQSIPAGQWLQKAQAEGHCSFLQRARRRDAESSTCRKACMSGKSPKSQVLPQHFPIDFNADVQNWE